MAKNITVYTTNSCVYCVMVKKWLAGKGFQYEEINLEEHPEKQAEAIQLSGAMTVPVTVVTKEDNTREVIIGFNLAKLAPALT